jgi:hypothetical protein
MAGPAPQPPPIVELTCSSCLFICPNRPRTMLLKCPGRLSFPSWQQQQSKLNSANTSLAGKNWARNSIGFAFMNCAASTPSWQSINSLLRLKSLRRCRHALHQASSSNRPSSKSSTFGDGPRPGCTGTAPPLKIRNSASTASIVSNRHDRSESCQNRADAFSSPPSF